MLSLGVLAELWLEFPEFEVVGLIVLARVLLEMCCGGRMFAPTKTQPQNNMPSVLLSALPALIMSKRHSIEEVPGLPLVVEDKVEGYKKAKEAVLLLKKLKAWNVNKNIYGSLQVSADKGKMRNCHCIQSTSPCIIYNQDNYHQGLQKHPWNRLI
ncbi:60S ribosomal protein L4 [Saguinus oedipus]|uniref:60S ribosomal protein L4 n=1 Tax=Saguinus oedipus TaxID=9490 RepID=A0ABQ9TJQ6_SAGOE|nr:60S ribosomal protein L4 [Saguinus oedipus]